MIAGTVRLIGALVLLAGAVALVGGLGVAGFAMYDENAREDEQGLVEDKDRKDRNETLMLLGFIGAGLGVAALIVGGVLRVVAKRRAAPGGAS